VVTEECPFGRIDKLIISLLEIGVEVNHSIATNVDICWHGIIRLNDEKLVIQAELAGDRIRMTDRTL